MDVGEWLRGLGLGKYEAAFLDNGIGEAVLAHLTVENAPLLAPLVDIPLPPAREADFPPDLNH